MKRLGIGFFVFCLFFWISDLGSHPVFFTAEEKCSYEAQAILEQLREQQYAIIDFDLSRQEVEEAVEAFYAFLELPNDLKNTIKLRIDKNHRRGDMGYTRKHRGNGDGDTKQFVHYHPALEEKYKPLMKKNPCVRRFFERARPIWQKAHDRLHYILKGMEEVFPGAHDRVFGVKEGQKKHITLRFLKYDIQHAGEKLARSHFDVGSCTFALAESRPGLRIGSRESNLKSVVHREKSAIFFLSKNYEAMIGKDSGLLPGWHDVVPLNKGQLGESVQRWSVVVFFDTIGATGGTKRETHQDPGALMYAT